MTATVTTAASTADRARIYELIRAYERLTNNPEIIPHPLRTCDCLWCSLVRNQNAMLRELAGLDGAR